MGERDIFKLMEPLMVFAVIGGVLIWQWLSIRAEIRKDRAAKPDPEG
jgi:hypothetical protein